MHDSGQQENQQGHNLEKDVDQYAGDGQIHGEAELRQKPRANGIAADHRKRDQRIDRIANEPECDKRARTWPSGISTSHQPMPAPHSATARATTTKAVPHRELATASRTGIQP